MNRITRSTRYNKNVLLVVATNKCNLRCYSCSTFCHTDIGSNKFNESLFILKPEILDEYLKNICDYKPDSYISLQGGELTILNPDLIKRYADIVRNHNRKVLCLTNGFRITDIDPYVFDAIVLDEHMQNRDDILKSVNYFDNIGYNNYSIDLVRFHMDLGFIMKDNRIKNDFICSDMYDAVSLYQGVVYPCCVAPMLQGYNNRIDYIEDLKICGFIYDNKYLSSLLNNIEEYLPDSFYDVCYNYCYRRKVKARKVFKPTNYYDNHGEL